MSHYLTLRRAEERVQKLIEQFDRYVDEFNQRNLFVGPSVYFHNKTLEILRQNNDPVKTIHDDRYFDYLYAMLTAWGLHRMGPGSTKLTEISTLKKSFQDQKEKIQFLQPFEIDNIPNNEIAFITDTLWDVINGLQVGVGKTKIVSGSKALHHLLPNLIPPIDRQYTIRFFYHHTTFNQGDEKAFKEIYPFFHQIAKSCKSKIENHLGKGKMSTSKTKIIDNAIVGFVLKEILDK